MSLDLLFDSASVHRRVEVADPELSAAVDQSVRDRAARAKRNPEINDPGRSDLIEQLSQVPGSKAQNLERWNERRNVTAGIGAMMATAGKLKLSERLHNCSNVLTLSRSGDERWKVGFFGCKVRECAVCDPVAAAKRQQRLTAAVRLLVAEHPKTRFLLLTLTVPNCELSELRMTILDMNAAWHRLSQRVAFVSHVLGWSRAVEVTRAHDGKAHPHMHVLLAVRPSYFSKGYVSKARWQSLWQEAVRRPLAIVDVRAVRQHKQAGSANLDGAISEVCKAANYSLKAQKLAVEDGWISELHDQQKSLRFYAFGGAIKDAVKAIEKMLAEMGKPDGDGDDFDEDGGGVSQRLLFDYFKQHQAYLRRRVPQ